jgi:hypothetical protein
MFRKNQNNLNDIEKIMTFLQLDPKEFKPFGSFKIISSLLIIQKTARERATQLQTLLCQLTEANKEAIYLEFPLEQPSEVTQLQGELAHAVMDVDYNASMMAEQREEMKKAYIVIDVSKVKNMEKLVFSYESPRI